MCLACTSKKSEFWRPRLRGIPSFWHPQILSNFIFSLFLLILKISSVQHKWLTFEFWRSWFILVPPNFVLSSYLHILNISCVEHEWLKSWNIGSPVCGVGLPPILISPNFVKFYLFFIFVNPKNFMCLAYVVRKFDFWQPHLRGNPNFGIPNCSKFYISFTLTYLKNFMRPALKVKKFELWMAPLTSNFGNHNFLFGLVNF